MASSSLSRSMLILGAALASVSALPGPLTPREPPPPPAQESPYTYLGCYSDNVGGKRALGGPSTASDDMTIEKCAAFCSKYELFGLEYGRECFCGNTRDSSSTEVDECDCSFDCAGDPDAWETCGAGDRLDLYSNTNPDVLLPASLPGITSLGCFVDNASRVLPSRRTAADDMTAAKCADHCDGFEYFGTQYSSECYCGSVAPTVSAPMSECDMPCSGDATEACGAGMRLNVYKIDSTSTEPGEPGEPDPTATPSIGEFEYASCWTDSVHDRSLTGHTHQGPDMTVELCAAECADYAFFGVEYARECFCGDELGGGAAPEADCRMRCEGDGSQWCGGPDRMNVYSKAASSPTPTGTTPEPTPTDTTPEPTPTDTTPIDEFFVNLIPEGDFETGLRGWTYVANGGGSVYTETYSPRTGNQGLTVSLHSSVSSTHAFTSRVIPVTPGGQYSFSFWYQHSNVNSDSRITFSLMPDGLESTPEEDALRGSSAGEWLEKGWMFEANSDWVQLTYTVSGTNDRIILDDISLVRYL